MSFLFAYCLCLPYFIIQHLVQLAFYLIFPVKIHSLRWLFEKYVFLAVNCVKMIHMAEMFSLGIAIMIQLISTMATSPESLLIRHFENITEVIKGGYVGRSNSNFTSESKWIIMNMISGLAGFQVEGAIHRLEVEEVVSIQYHSLMAFFFSVFTHPFFYQTHELIIAEQIIEFRERESDKYFSSHYPVNN